MTDPIDKPALRKRFRAARGAIPEADRNQRSGVLINLLLSIDRMQHAASVFVYVSAGSEVVTHGLVNTLLEMGRVVAVPRVLPEMGRMQAVVIRSLSDLSPGRYGVLEPTRQQVLDTTPDLAVVPGLAFTRAGRRLGQGGGYYDRYLAQHPAAYKVGVCFNEQITDVLPVTDLDIAMDEVVSA